MTITTFHRIAAAALATVAASCAAPAETVACEDLRVGEAETALMILTDGASPAARRTLDRLADDPDAVFSSATTGLDAGAGIVTLATFDSDGQILEHGSFNLGGVGGDKVRRRANAVNQANCLTAAAEALPDVPEGGGNLLRALPTAAALATSHGTDRATVAIHGFGRSDNDGFVLAQADLGTSEARATVLATLAQVNVVADLGADGTSLVFVAPGEGVASAVGSAAVTTFVSELCPMFNAPSCASVEVLS